MHRIFTLALPAILALMLIAPAPARAVEKAAVDEALKRAKIYLKTQFVNGGDTETYGEAPAALTGIALLLAGEKPADPIIQVIARAVRLGALAQGSTYHIACDLIFLDHLGEQADAILIQSLAARLIWGQSVNGGWDYRCPTVDAVERDRIVKIMLTRRAKPEGGPIRLDEKIREIIEKGTHLQHGQAAPPVRSDDNSNTQFATIALWSARKYAVPVDTCFDKIDQRFRKSQNQDGGWGYRSIAPQSTPSMTCAGLLGLAAAMGNSTERSMRSTGKFDGNQFRPNKGGGPGEPAAGKPVTDYRNDKAIMAGLNYLGAMIAANKRVGPGGVVGGEDGGGHGLRDDMYFIWSVERVAVIYNLDKIGNIDWFDWGASHLVKTQKPEGYWYYVGGHYRNPIVDTAFGVIFLSRGNIAKDLERLMRGGRMPVAKPEAGPADAEAAALTKSLLAAPPAIQKKLIDDYKRATGAKYSLALADAIPRLKDDMRTAARDALAERMARLSAKSLTGYLDHDNAELRRAASLGVAMRDERELIPALLVRLDDVDELVWRAAALALKTMSGKDFGPKKGATPAERDKAIKDWTDWYEKVEKLNAKPDKN